MTRYRHVCPLHLLSIIATGMVFFAMTVHAQPREVTFERVLMPDGGIFEEGGIGINAITQDHEGFMWFGGRHLHKYDGYNLTTYRHDPDDPNTFSSNYIESLFVDRKGTLWIGTGDDGGGLHRFNRETETFTHYRHDPDDATSLSHDWVLAMLEDREGTLWVGTVQGGLNRLDRETGTFTHYRHDPSDPTSLSEDRIQAIYEDREGTLWVGTWSQGLNRFDRETQAFTRYLHDPEDELSLSTSLSVWALLEDSRGTFWVGTHGDGLHTMDRRTGTFTRYRYDPNDPGKLSRPHLKQGPTPVDMQWQSMLPRWQSVISVHEDRAGMIWIGGLGGGINLYDLETETLRHYEADSTEVDGLDNNFVWRIYESHDGTVWISTWGGLFKAVPVPSPVKLVHHQAAHPDSLSHPIVVHLEESQDGTIWIATLGGGLNRLDPTTGRFTHFRNDPDDPNSLSTDGIIRVMEDRSGILWIGTGSAGLDRFDPATGWFTHFPHNPDDPASLSGGRVVSILESRDGTLWVGTWGQGLNRFDRETGTFSHYLHDPEDPGSLSNDIMGIGYEDRSGTLWFSTVRGLNRFNPDDETPGSSPGQRFTRYLDGSAIFSLYEDSAGRFWVGTWGDGLVLLDRETGQHVRYDEEDGLPSNNIAGLVEDEDGLFWISTSEGFYNQPVQGRISRFDPASETFVTYGPADGVPEFRPIPGSVLKRRDGTLMFGGKEGFITFDPKTFSKEPLPPKMALTGLSLFNDRVEPTTDGPLKRPLNLAGQIKLGHDQNDFTIDYVGLSYPNPAEIRYRYMLENHDRDWVKARTQRSAQYSRLAPGQYVFRVQGVYKGAWSVEDASVVITILAPWWRTGWAYALYVAALSLLLYGGYQWRVRRLRTHTEELRNMVKARTLTLSGEKRKLAVEKARSEEKSRKLQDHADKLQVLTERLIEHEEVKDRFFANISHEFRTPLTLILGPLNDLLSETSVPLDPALRRRLQVMQRSGVRLHQLIDQLLDLSKLEVGRMRLQAQLLDLIPFLREIVRSFAPLAERRCLTLQFKTEVDLMLVYFDPDKLDKAIANLLSNALKFTPEQGRVRVSVSKGRDEHNVYAEISIKDNGPGIPANEVPYIFNRFYQIDTSSRRTSGGTGIGLALAQELVELHGGTVRVESEEGFGSEFIVRLHAGRAHLSDSTIVEVEQEQKEWTPPTMISLEEVSISEGGAFTEVHPIRSDEASVILLVEDHADVRQYLRDHLAPWYRIAEASDGLEGLEQAHSIRPDLIIADVMMPRMDGFELCKAIKEDEILNHIPVILLTAKASEKAKLEGLKAGADDYIYKPFSAEEVLTRVENLIEIRRMLRERYGREIVMHPTDVTVQSAEAAFLEQVLAVVEAHMADNNFTVEWLADEVGLSPRQLQRRLRALTKLSPAGYIRAMRLSRAAQLLAQRAGNISEVAYQVGFKDPYYFSRLFRQTFGVAPSSYADQSSDKLNPERDTGAA